MDETGVGAIMCIHGLMTKCIAYHGGELYGYTTTLLYEICDKFPNAKIVFSYDINCMYINSLRVFMIN